MPYSDDGRPFRCQCQRTAPDGSRWLSTVQIEGGLAFRALVHEHRGCYWGGDASLDLLGTRPRLTYRKLLLAASRAQLSQLLRHESPRVRLAASEWVAQRFPEDIASIVPLLADSSLVTTVAPAGTTTVAEQLGRSLCGIGTPEVEVFLREQAQKTKSPEERSAPIPCPRPSVVSRAASSRIRASFSSLSGRLSREEAMRSLRDARDPANAAFFASIVSAGRRASGADAREVTVAIQGLALLGRAAEPSIPLLEEVASGPSYAPIAYAALEALVALRARPSVLRVRDRSRGTPSHDLVTDLLADLDASNESPARTGLPPED